MLKHNTPPPSFTHAAGVTVQNRGLRSGQLILYRGGLEGFVWSPAFGKSAGTAPWGEWVDRWVGS